MAAITLFIIKCIYLMLPGIFANMAPILFKNHFKKLAIPIDLNKTYKGKRILGDNKTLRGFVLGILLSIIIVYIQTLLYSYPTFQSISFVNYETTNFLLLGFLIGFGVLFGDSFESFIKRRLDIAPGSSFMPWDQIDSVIGAIIFISIVYTLNLAQISTIIAMSFLFSVLISRIGYASGLRKEKI
jgi:CDP-2,3-bis-(O-geranylgeranyl)-sn-glycerol synthase